MGLGGGGAGGSVPGGWGGGTSYNGVKDQTLATTNRSIKRLSYTRFTRHPIKTRERTE